MIDQEQHQGGLNASNLGRLIDEACGRARGDDSWKVNFLLSALEEIVNILGSTDCHGAYLLRNIEFAAKEAIRRVGN